jgi:hypothetical protein
LKTTYCSKTGLLAALGVAAVLVAALPAIAEEQEQAASLQAARTVFIGQLDALAVYMPVMDISRRIAKRLEVEPGKQEYALEWAKGRSVGVKSSAAINSLYFMIHSDLSRQMTRLFPPRDENYALHARAAWQSLIVFETLLMTDIARCKDSRVAEGAAKLLPQRYEDAGALNVAISPDDMAGFWKYALALEEAAVLRPPNAEVCNNSLAVAVADMAGQPAPEKIDPAYLNAAEWTAARVKARAALDARQKQLQAAVAKTYAARKAEADATRAAAQERTAAEAAMKKAQEDARLKKEQALRARAEALRAKEEAAKPKPAAPPAPKTKEDLEKEARQRLEAERVMRQQERYEQQLRAERQRDGYYEEGSDTGGDYSE